MSIETGLDWGIVGQTIRHEAENRIRLKVRELLLSDLEPVIDELVDSFLAEFKEDIEATFSKSARDFTSYVDVTVRTKHIKKDPLDVY